MKKVFLVFVALGFGFLASGQSLIDPAERPKTAPTGRNIVCEFGSRDFKVGEEKLSVSLDARYGSNTLDLTHYTAELSVGTEGPEDTPTEASLTVTEKSGTEALRILWQDPTALKNITTHGFTGLVYLKQTTAKEDSRELQLWCTIEEKKEEPK